MRWKYKNTEESSSEPPSHPPYQPAFPARTVPRRFRTVSLSTTSRENDHVYPTSLFLPLMPLMTPPTPRLRTVPLPEIPIDYPLYSSKLMTGSRSSVCLLTVTFCKQILLVYRKQQRRPSSSCTSCCAPPPPDLSTMTSGAQRLPSFFVTNGTPDQHSPWPLLPLLSHISASSSPLRPVSP